METPRASDQTIIPCRPSGALYFTLNRYQWLAPLATFFRRSAAFSMNSDDWHLAYDLLHHTA